MIVQCRECGHDVSSEAVACPSCGCPQQPASATATTSEGGPTPPAATPTKAKSSHIHGFLALIAFVLADFTPAILAPLIVLAGFAFALLETSKGSKLFGGIMVVLLGLQTWFIIDHFGKVSGSLGFTTPQQIEENTAKKYSQMSMDIPANASQIISQKCSEEWPSDYRMQKYCDDQQRTGIAALNRGQPSSVPHDAFVIIRGKCAQEWPRDFKMRAYCESQQYDGYAGLQASSAPDSTRGGCAQKWPDDYKMRLYCLNH